MGRERVKKELDKREKMCIIRDIRERQGRGEYAVQEPFQRVSGWCEETRRTRRNMASELCA